ncbi:MAG: PAS domain-containing sensor histidine kinase [Methanomicrobiales archaeon]|nr:PAS domain-containing sensor histidine kinase [Methanomicrobiales archaeon]
MHSGFFASPILRDLGLRESDLVKIWVIACFVMVSVLVTVFSFTVPTGAVYPALLFLFPQLYYIPIVLISIWYPRYGLQCTILLVVAFLGITSYYYYLGTPIDPFILGINAAMYLWVVVATTQLAKEGGLLNVKYWNVFKNAEAGMFLCNDMNMKIVDANQKLGELLGYEPSELRGLPAEELWENPQDGATILKECSEKGSVVERKVRFLGKSGELMTALLSCKKTMEQQYIECTVFDITKIEKEEIDLKEAKEQLQYLVNSSQDLIFMQDGSGRFLQFHWAKAPEYGIDTVEIIGKTLSDLFPQNVADAHNRRIREVFRHGQTINFDFTVTLKGTERVFSTLLGPVADQSGKTIGVIGTMRDVTDGLQQDLTYMQLERELDRWRNFINTAAHELRTPLQPILGYLHLILEDPSSYALDSETVKLLRLCLENVERERRVVDRMLELGIMDSCKIQLKVTEFSLRQLISTVTRIGGYDLQAEFNCLISPDVTICADRDRLYQVLDGIISNAVRYSNPPRIVKIDYSTDEQHHFISIKDNGIGIAKKSQKAIFEPFYLADSEKLAREYGRIGLGLSIAQKYVDMHKGKIIVDSEPGAGSTFTVQLPKVVCDEP